MQLIIIEKTDIQQSAVVLNGHIIFIGDTNTGQAEGVAEKLTSALGIQVSVYIHEPSTSNLSWEEAHEALVSKGLVVSTRSINDTENALISTSDQYKTLCVSTSHLTRTDMQALEVLANDIDCNMIAGRDTGWFVKLYEEPQYNKEYSGCSEYFHHILITSLNNGYRMIEFDGQAEQYDDFPLFD